MTSTQPFLSGVGEVILAVYRSESILEKFRKICRSRKSTVFGSASGTSAVAAATEFESVRRSNLVLVICDCQVPRDDGQPEVMRGHALLQTFRGKRVAGDDGGLGLTNLPFIIHSEKYAEKVLDLVYEEPRKNVLRILQPVADRSPLNVVLIEKSKKPTKAGKLVLEKLNKIGKEAIYFSDCPMVLALLSSQENQVGLIVVASEMLDGNSVLADFSQFEIPVVVQLEVAKNVEFDYSVCDRYFEAGALMVILKPFHDIYNPFLVSLMVK